MHVVKALVDRSFNVAVKRLPPKARTRLTYLKCHRQWPDLRRPSRFSELCQATKFSGLNLAPFVDKIAVKDFVRERIGSEYVIPTLYAGERLPPLSERDWPLPFIIKTSHTSGGNIFVRETPDWAAIERELAIWLAFDYARAADELFYSAVPPRLLVEPIIDDNPPDYKIFTFGGEPEVIQVDTDRQTGHKRAFFDCSWNRLAIRCNYPVDEREIPQPTQLSRMLEIAADLGRDFPFVRIDLYETKGKVHFGELTFCPEAGNARFDPAEVEAQWGKLWLRALTPTG